MAFKPMDVPEFSFTFVDPHKVITPAKKEGGWNLEFNHVVWGDAEEAKYDIRQWSPDHKKMGKGISLTKEGCINLRNILCETFGDPEPTDGLTDDVKSTFGSDVDEDSDVTEIVF